MGICMSVVGREVLLDNGSFWVLSRSAFRMQVHRQLSWFSGVHMNIENKSISLDIAQSLLQVLGDVSLHKPTLCNKFLNTLSSVFLENID